MATIQNARDVLLQAAATRLETVAGPTNVTTDFANVTGSTRPSNNADVTQTAVNSGVTASSGGITLSSGGAIKGGQTAYDSGNGFFLGYTGGAYKFSVGNSSGNKFTWDGSTLGIVGDISGTSNLNVSGQAVFSGNNTTGGYTSAMHVNLGYGSVNGIVAAASGFAAFALRGIATASACGVSGEGTSSAVGVQGTSSGAGGAGVLAIGASGADALNVVGKAVLDNSTFTWNGYTYSAPAGSTSTYMRNDGTWSNPVTTSAVNAAFGASESDVCQIVVGNTGTATVAGTGLNLTTTVSGVTVTCSSNNIVIEPVSDARLKRDIEDEALGLGFIRQLRPRTYRMKADPALLYHGFLYQELAEVLPREGDALVQHRPDRYGGVDYNSLIAPLVLAVQQLAARVQQLESA